MKLIAGFMLVGLGATACGAGVEQDPAARPSAPSIVDASGGLEPQGPERPPSQRSPLPAVEAIDVSTGQRVNVASLVPAARPVLIWFWAPHCPVCNVEAPGVERFARAHADELDVVGLGTQDDLSLAKSFVSRHEISFRMLWDPSFESWRALGVPGQPSALLLGADGEPLRSWVGPFDEDEVERLIRT